MKRTTVLVLIFILFITLFHGIEQTKDNTAYAQGVTQGEITASSLFVRADASPTAKIIGGFSKGAKVEIHETKNSWYKVRFNNGWGYIHSGYVKTAAAASNQSSSLGTGEITASSLNIRSAASTSASITGSVKRGAKVELLEKKGEWYKIKSGSREGFVHGSYVKVSGNADSSSKKAEGSSNVTKGEITASSLNVRSSASTSASIISSLKRGATVDLHEKSGNWYKIKVGNTWGYIHDSYVKTAGSGSANTAPAESSKTTTGEVTASSLNVRAEASTSAKITGSLTRGTRVEIHEKNNNWYTIKTNGSWGYVHASYVREVSANAGTTGSGTGSLSGKTIFLDPGHGGKDPGAVAGNVYEKTITLSLSHKIKQKLEAEGARVVMSRADDRFISIGNRVTQANQSGANLFISVHTNAFPNAAASGAEVLYSAAGKHPNDSRMLALELQSAIANGMNFRNRGTVNRSLQVLTGPNMPAVLIEPGFITNSGDLAKLVNEQDKLAGEVVKGLKNYYK
ncbi:SH3 domain-containing protein [Alkalicoccus daliensis]|uniref:N-acetylmuramoyl-L-alanine amidase n=1 Tax=Alkalicoccus daliensis TaxID=745820 RepID=A0A1H0GHH3_9BACI|nr:SH3 domain-containing protein [Alkalicoccus daliensis]SDO06334.1 N-acetylmuramoyl-L-alanine amidase [Alkalicoccus daliensis]